ncbi:MAG: glycosyl hydrolase family 25 [Prevotella sp.]|nr:glycosyl hydrolase family 25 [Candidatus Prevotella equi]
MHLVHPTALISKSWYYRLPSSQQAHLLMKARMPKHPAMVTSAIDSLGTYEGERDSIARPNGYGRFRSDNGDFYEGEWKEGKRCGVGFSIIPGKRLRLGEWDSDNFLGERIAYTPERIYGIDISRHQHEKGKKRYSINWKDLRITSLGHKSKKNIKGVVDYPVKFVYIKATEGVTIRNKYFTGDYAAARKNGYKTGAYHFFSIRTPGKNQAINFLRNSKYHHDDLPPVLDIEPTDAQIRQAGGIQALFRNVRQWLNAVEGYYHVRPILYISQRFVNKYLPLAPDLQKNYDVWIARYGEYKPDVNLIYWQLSPDGRVNGIHGEVDINVLNGFSL